ncbi:MAG: RIO1 family regulatory kinase/ATPase domain-containing protein [Promethearchaeota archaeon]
MGYDHLTQQRNSDQLQKSFDDSNRYSNFSSEKKVHSSRSEISMKEIQEQLNAAGKIGKIYSIIGQGKEALVLTAQEILTNQPVCVKIFKFYSSTNKKRIEGTHHIRASGMAMLAAKQEYWNLKEMFNHDIPVPKPLHLLQNILIMDLIPLRQNSIVPAMLLKDYQPKTKSEAEDLLEQSIDIIARLFIETHFVHGDYSLHNLLITNGKVYTIDVSQSVQYNIHTFTDTPIRIRVDKAAKILKRDLSNLIQGFKQKFRIIADVDEIYRNIISQIPKHLLNRLDTAQQFNAIKYYNGDLARLKGNHRNNCRRKGKKRKHT